MSDPGKKITGNALLETMATADVLEIFHSLPAETQVKFQSWIDKARNASSQWRRIDALVLAMRIGPLYPPSSPPSQDLRREPAG